MRGWLHAWEPRCKVAALLGAAGGVAFLHHWYAALLAFALAALLAGVSRLSLRFVVAYLSILTLAAIPFVLILPWTLRDGRPAWVEWGPLTFHPYGLETGLAVGLRLAAIGLLALTLFGTTPWSELLAALHRLGLPAALVWIVALARQYAELLGREFQRLRAALRVRGFRPRPTWHGYRHLGYACGALLVHGAERA
ncbi:MAG: energy-coupling factor transporter transmembrane protein EcfT, partial [Gemmataceae bacterium]|nr:energy-coupling factor transporter transmembrane protein EcfT [Gemmataceae bacterium]